MTRQVLYVAHALRPTVEEMDTQDIHDALDIRIRATELNLHRAMRWLAWLRASFPQDTFIAPWIAAVMAGADDADQAQRQARIVDACAVIERCDGIVLCGSRISDGMRREADHWLHSHGYDRAAWGPEAFRANASPLAIYDMTRGGLVEPPAIGTGFDGQCPWSIGDWYGMHDKARWSEVTP